MEKERRLYPEDQARVDRYLHSGCNSVERKPFRPFRLLLILLVIISVFSGVSLWIPRMMGIY